MSETTERADRGVRGGRRSDETSPQRPSEAEPSGDAESPAAAGPSADTGPPAEAGPPSTVQRDPSRFAPRIERRHRTGTVFAVICFGAALIGVIVLAALLVDIFVDGAGALSLDFLNSLPSRRADRAGIKPALLGSLWVLILTAVISFPLGVGTAVWLEEYAPNNRLTRAIETNIANLAGVPSIVFGILGLAVFVRAFAMGRSIIAAALTLALLILPVIIIASQEAIKAVPSSMRLAAYALGATRWETVRHHVLPAALPGILTGTILALSRAVGEAAPMIMVGALGFLTFVPSGPLDRFAVLPFQIYDWVSRADPDFHHLAAAASIVLLVLLLAMNAAAIYLRNRYSRRG